MFCFVLFFNHELRAYGPVPMFVLGYLMTLTAFRMGHFILQTEDSNSNKKNGGTEHKTTKNSVYLTKQNMSLPDV